MSVSSNTKYDDWNYFKNQYQTEQFVSAQTPGCKSVVESLESPAASALTALTVKQADESAEEHTAFLAGTEQFKGMFHD